MGKVRHQHKAIHCKSFQPAADIFDLPLWFLRRGREDQLPIKKQLRIRVGVCMNDVRREQFAYFDEFARYNLAH